MAEHGASTDLAAHERSYARFIGVFKYSAIFCFCVALLIIFVISR